MPDLTPEQKAAVAILGLPDDPEFLAAYDDGLDDLIRSARQVFADLGPNYGREHLARMFAVGGEKNPHLLAAALLRLTDWKGAR